MYIKPRYTFFDRFYADFDPFSLNGDNEGRQSWKMPASRLTHGVHLIQIFSDGLRFSVFNLLNKVYLINSQNNDPYGSGILITLTAHMRLQKNNFDSFSQRLHGLRPKTNFSVRVDFKK